MMPTSVNIHFHGLNVKPRCHGDEVIHTIVNPGANLRLPLQGSEGRTAGNVLVSCPHSRHSQSGRSGRRLRRHRSGRHCQSAAGGRRLAAAISRLSRPASRLSAEAPPDHAACTLLGCFTKLRAGGFSPLCARRHQDAGGGTGVLARRQRLGRHGHGCRPAIRRQGATAADRGVRRRADGFA